MGFKKAAKHEPKREKALEARSSRRTIAAAWQEHGQRQRDATATLMRNRPLQVVLFCALMLGCSYFMSPWNCAMALAANTAMHYAIGDGKTMSLQLQPGNLIGHSTVRVLTGVFAYNKLRDDEGRMLVHSIPVWISIFLSIAINWATVALRGACGIRGALVSPESMRKLTSRRARTR